MCIGEADLNEMLLAVGLGNGSVVELLDHLIADIASLETVDGQQGSDTGYNASIPGETDTTAGASGVTKDPA